MQEIFQTYQQKLTDADNHKNEEFQTLKAKLDAIETERDHMRRTAKKEYIETLDDYQCEKVNRDAPVWEIWKYRTNWSSPVLIGYTMDHNTAKRYSSKYTSQSRRELKEKKLRNIDLEVVAKIAEHPNQMYVVDGNRKNYFRP